MGARHDLVTKQQQNSDVNCEKKVSVFHSIKKKKKQNLKPHGV